MQSLRRVEEGVSKHINAQENFFVVKVVMGATKKFLVTLVGRGGWVYFMGAMKTFLVTFGRD